MNRLEFLKIATLGMGGLFMKTQEPEPDNTVYLPTISNGSQGDYVKLVEYTVSYPAGFASGFAWTDLGDFGDFRKYVIDCTVSVSSEISWYPNIRINEIDSVSYLQSTKSMIELHAGEQGEYDSIPMPGTIYNIFESDPLPYTIHFEIMNVEGMFAQYGFTGSCPIHNEFGYFSFSGNGVVKTTDPIERIDLYTMALSMFFGSGTVVSLYGVR